MSITCIHQVALESHLGSSDKIYVVRVHEDLTGPAPAYKTMGFNARRGSTLKEQTPVYSGPNRASAIAEAEKLANGKRRGSSRYTDMVLAAGAQPPGMPAGAPVYGGPGVSASSAASPATSGPLVTYGLMLAKEATSEQLEEMLHSADWAEQRKYDGERCSVSLRRGSIVAYNRKGMQKSLSAVAEAELKKLTIQPDFSNDRETILDGELMGDVYIAFDLLTIRDVDMRTMPFYERYGALEALMDNHQGLLAPTAWTEEEKEAMRTQAAAESWEGTMGRHVDAPYVAGRSDKVRKNKQWASCTCRVLTAHPTKRSVQIALRDDDGFEEACGNVTIPVNQDMPDVDELVEVKYLYALPGGSLYQPIFHGVRDDKDEADLRSTIRNAPPEKTGGTAIAMEASEPESEDDEETCDI